MLKRKSPLRAKTPMARKPMQKKAKRKQSTDKRWRSEPYLKWVRSQPCCACATYGCDAHHVIGMHWNLSGMGLTAPDSFAMSLCRACHSLTHQNPKMQSMQPDWLRHTLRMGIQQFDDEALMHALAYMEAREQ
jgi:hypothetical protein